MPQNAFVDLFKPKKLQNPLVVKAEPYKVNIDSLNPTPPVSVDVNRPWDAINLEQPFHKPWGKTTDIEAAQETKLYEAEKRRSEQIAKRLAVRKKSSAARLLDAAAESISGGDSFYDGTTKDWQEGVGSLAGELVTNIPTFGAAGVAKGAALGAIPLMVQKKLNNLYHGRQVGTWDRILKEGFDMTRRNTTDRLGTMGMHLSPTSSYAGSFGSDVRGVIPQGEKTLDLTNPEFDGLIDTIEALKQSGNSAGQYKSELDLAFRESDPVKRQQILDRLGKELNEAIGFNSQATKELFSPSGRYKYDTAVYDDAGYPAWAVRNPEQIQELGTGQYLKSKQGYNPSFEDRATVYMNNSYVPQPVQPAYGNVPIVGQGQVDLLTPKIASQFSDYELDNLPKGQLVKLNEGGYTFAKEYSYYSSLEEALASKGQQLPLPPSSTTEFADEFNKQLGSGPKPVESMTSGIFKPGDKIIIPGYEPIDFDSIVPKDYYYTSKGKQGLKYGEDVIGDLSKLVQNKYLDQDDIDELKDIGILKPSKGTELAATLKSFGKVTYTPVTQAGGTHGAMIVKGSDGKDYIQKPYSKPYLAATANTASKIANNFNMYTPIEVIDGAATYQVKKNYKTLREIYGDNETALKAMTKDQLRDLQQEHIVDWLVGNHDAHSGQFLVDDAIHVGNPIIIGIDKGQAFKHYFDDKLDPFYHPNSKFGEEEPIYNTMMKMYQSGQLDLDDSMQWLSAASPFQIGKARTEVEKLAKIKYPADHAGEKAFLEAFDKRANLLKSDFEELYSKYAPKAK